MKDGLIDLLATPNTSFVGKVGELFAHQYLWDKKIYCHRPNSQHLGFLTHEQQEYVRELMSSGPTWCWDLVGYDYRMAYLVEVKTNRPGKTKVGLPRGKRSDRSRRGFTSSDLDRAKALGFKPLLVNVELQPDWQAQISAKAV